MSLKESVDGFYVRDFGNVAGKWPWPIEENSFVIFSPSMIEGYRSFAGLALHGKCAVAVFETDDAKTLGNRIWHEILHAMATYDNTTHKDNVNPDLLNPNILPNDIEKFCNWLKKDPRYSPLRAWCLTPENHPGNDILEAYYAMLTEKYFPPCKVVKPVGPDVNDNSNTNDSNSKCNILRTILEKLLNLLHAVVGF